MTSSSSYETQLPNDDSIWLVVQCDKRTTSFELPVIGHRAIVVGSTIDADIRIEGIAPVAFYLEREGSAVQLTLAYPEPSLRVDSQRVERAIRICGRGTVEFGEVCLLLRIRDTPPTVRVGGRAPAEEIPPGPFFCRPATRASHEVATRELAPVSTFRPEPEPSLLDGKTVEMSPFRTIETAPIRLDAMSGRAAPIRSGQTTAFDMPVLPSVPARTEERTGPAPERRASVPSGVAVSKPKASGAALASLGLLTKRHPVGVIGGAALGSVVMLLCLVGTAQLLGGRSEQKAPVNAAPAPLSALQQTPPTVAASSALVPATPSGAAEAPASHPVSPDVRGAVGHLFAGRLPEAEQAYRELASRRPDEPAFKAAARILARRNGPGCKVASPTKSSCPMVKP